MRAAYQPALDGLKWLAAAISARSSILPGPAFRKQRYQSKTVEPAPFVGSSRTSTAFIARPTCLRERMILPLLLLASLHADRLAPGGPEGARRIGSGQLLSAAFWPKNLDNRANESPSRLVLHGSRNHRARGGTLRQRTLDQHQLDRYLPTSETGSWASEGEPRL